MFHIFYNLVKQQIQELVRILVHRPAEELVQLLELVDERARRDRAALRRVLADVQEERAQCGWADGRERRE